MTNEELNEWERLSFIRNVLTSKEFGAWLHRRDKNKEKQRGKANCRFCKDLIIDDISLADHFRIRSMDVYQDFKFIHTNGWRLMSLEDEEGYPLNFCPECGKDLRREVTNGRKGNA